LSTPAERQRGRDAATPFAGGAVSVLPSDLTNEVRCRTNRRRSPNERPAVQAGNHTHLKEAWMRKLIVSTYATLDGRVDELQDWVLPHDHEASLAYHSELLKNVGGLLLGRKTYDIFAAIWPPRSGQHPYIDKINSMPKYVASTTLTDLSWENSQLIDGDVGDRVAELKQQTGGDLVVYGCRDLTHTLAQRDLVDEYRILVHPVLLGRGRTLFDGPAPVHLELVDTAVMTSQVVLLTYRPVR
jgi:dihydrofolate reductase